MRQWKVGAGRWLMLALALLVLSGCGSRFFYNRLDTLARWELDDYIELSDEQDAWLRQRLAAQLERHRRVALPRYADWLESLERDLAEPMDRARLDGHFQGFNGLREDLLRQLLPDGIAFLAGLSDEQIDPLFAALEEDNRDYDEEVVSAPREKVLKHRLKELRGSFRDWLGALNPDQEARLAQWLGEFQLASADQLAYQRAWQAELRGALVYRRDRARFAARVEALFLYPERLRDAAFQATVDNNIAAFRRLILDLNGQLGAKQRERLRRKLRGYAEDFRAWSADA